MEIYEGGRVCSDVVEMPTGGIKDVVENAKAVRRSAVAVKHGCDAAVESLLNNRDIRLWLEASGQENTTVGSLGWCRGPRMGTSGRSNILTIEIPLYHPSKQTRRQVDLALVKCILAGVPSLIMTK